MTPKEAERILEQGCTHNPWTEDVCGNCAKDILEIMVNKRVGTEQCRTCGDLTHSTSEHVKWTTFMDEDEDEL